MNESAPHERPVRRALTALSLVLDRVVRSLNAIGTLIIIALMALICSDVISRNVLGASLPGVTELAQLSIVSIVYLQIADTLRSGKLIRSDVLIRKLAKGFPRMALALGVVFDTAGAALFYFLTAGAVERFVKAWTGGFYVGNLGSFTAPTWPMELSVAVGSALVFLLLAGRILENGAALLSGTPPSISEASSVGEQYTP